jgi:hypothetical protein
MPVRVRPIRLRPPRQLNRDLLPDGSAGCLVKSFCHKVLSVYRPDGEFADSSLQLRLYHP